MKGKLRKPSPAMIVACVALFVALGPAAYASHLVVTTSDIVDGEVRSPDLRDFGVTNVDLGANSVGTGKVIDGNLQTVDLADGAVTNAKLGADSVETAKIIDGGIQTADLADGAVTSAKVLDDTSIGGGLNQADLASNSVGTSEIQTDGVQALEIADNSIDSGEIIDFTLTNQDVGVLFAQINADGTVANSSGGVTTVKIGTGTYEVDFGRNISGCAFVMTQGEATAGGAGGAITGATDRSGNAEAVFATTRTNANALADRAFQLVVVC